MKQLELATRIKHLRESTLKEPNNQRLQNRLQNLLNQQQINEQLPKIKN